MSDAEYPQKPNELIAYSPGGAIVDSRVPALEVLGPNIHGAVPLANYWYVLLKRRWTILVIAVLLAGVAAAISFLMTPVYQATARLEVEPEAPTLQQSTGEKVDVDDAFLQTQIQVLRSDNLEWQTIQQLNLANHFSERSTDSSSQTSDKRKVQLLNTFDAHLKVDQVPKTRILNVSFLDADPNLAAQVATAHVNNYLEYNFQEKDQAIRRSGWMEQQVETLRANVEQSQEALVRYEQQNQIVNSNDKQNVLEQMLSDQSRDLTVAQSDRIQKESLYRQVIADRTQLASLVHDELLEKLEEKAADLKQQYTQTAAQYGPNFPNAKRLQLEINENQDEIQRERDRAINRITNDYNAASNREKLAAAEVSQEKGEVGRLNQLMIRDNLLRREFETNQQLYESLLQRVKDATVSAALRSTNIHLVDSALPPLAPLRPRKLFNIAAALWAGLIIGVILAFGQEAFDSSVKTAEEAEALMLAPALGIIPFERLSWRQSQALAKQFKTERLALNLTSQPNCSLSEAFRALGTAVAVPSKPIKTLLVTSTQTGEGKTTTALNLAHALAQRKGPVLLIDCDLRKGDLAKSIGQRDHKGLTAVLSGGVFISNALHAVQPNLWLLPAGAMPPDPVATLASQEMASLLEKLAGRFEFVIIDSPPVLAVTDAAILSSLVDGVLLVTASGSTPRTSLIRARRILESSGANILGMAVNKLDPRHPGFGYYSKYAYKVGTRSR